MTLRRFARGLAAASVSGALVGVTPTCGCEHGTPPCMLAELGEEGWVPVVDGTVAPLAVGSLRRTICLHGVLPCGEEVAGPTSRNRDVLLVLTDAAVPWVHHLGGVSAGAAEVRMRCEEHGERAFHVRVR